MSYSESPGDSENPYLAPSSAPEAPAGVSSADSTQQELMTFVGRKADYYLGKWRLLLTGAGRDAGFNWAAFFLSGFWIAYRKMYKVAIIFYAIVILESLAEEVLFIGILGKPETPAVIERIAGLAFALICGGFGNRWYYSHARRTIAEVHEEGIEGTALLDTISRRGGTSLGAALGMFLLFFIVVIGVFTIVEMLLASI